MLLISFTFLCLLVNLGSCAESSLNHANIVDFDYKKIISESLLKYSNLGNLSQYEDLPLKKVQQFSLNTSSFIQEIAENSSNIIQKFARNSSNDLCSATLKRFLNDVTQFHPNALKILDSWGKLESGIWDGNIIWEGRYFQCLESDFDEDVSGQYCAAYVPLPGGLSPTGQGSLTIAICIPDICSEAYISSLLTSVAPGLIQGVACMPPDNGWTAVEIAGLFILCLLAFLVVLSTLYDCIFQYKFHMHDETSHGRMIRDETSDPFFQPQQENHQPEICHQVLVSFSVIQNTKRLLDTTQKATDITCLHGIRFLSMSWVILGHSFLLIAGLADNLRFLARYTVEHYEFQVLTNAFFSVDSFFFLSGLLVVYLGMRQLRRREGKMNVPFMYFYRYLRLTPPYAFLILISIGLFTKFGDGPFWPGATQSLADQCDKYWYSSLLYFGNLYPAQLEAACFSWGWYLSNDTQFYLLSPLFLWLLYKNRKIGIAFLVFFLVASMSLTGAFSAYTKQQPTAMTYGLLAKFASEPLINGSLLGNLGDASNQTYSPYISDLYTKPWFRIGAYLVGMLTGYVLYACKNKVKMNKITVVLGWVTAFIVNFLLVYACYPSYSKGEAWSVNLAAFYNAVSRPVWCMGLAWVTIACVSGYGGPVNTLLSWKAFIPLSRLTYCSYLIHPLVITWFNASAEVQAHYSIYMVITQFFLNLGMATLLAYVVAMLVEFPVIALLKILQENMSRRKISPPNVYANEEQPEHSLLSKST